MRGGVVHCLTNKRNKKQIKNELIIFPFLILPNKMFIKPMTREMMIQINTQTDEELRNQSEKFRMMRIEQFIQNIYRAAINIAMNKKRTSYNFPLGEEFLLENINDILAGLQLLFPDSIVSKMVTNPYNTGSTKAHVDIDWS